MELQKRFTYQNPSYHKAKAMNFSTKGIPPLLKTYRVTKTTPAQMVISRGAIGDVRKILKRHGHRVKILDHRISFPKMVIPDNITLREEQVDPVDAILTKKQGCIRGPCSAGKTVMLLKAIVEAGQPALVVVWETVHQRGWVSEIEKFLHIDKSEIGGCGGIFKKPKFGLINVCMQQSLRNKKNLDFFVDRVGLVAGDEIQRFAASTFQDVMNEFPAIYRIGVSANERRKDGKQFLVYDTFGKVLHQIEDIDVGSRRPSKIFMIPTKFHSEGYDETGMWTDFISEMSEDEERNDLIVKAVHRLSLAKKKIALILTERKAHALWLREQFSGYSTGFLVGKTTAKEINESGWPDEWKEFMRRFDSTREFERVKMRAEKKKIDVIIGTQKANVGINILTLDDVFITTPTATNPELFNQQKGRVERDYDKALEKKFGVKATPHVYYFWDVLHESLQKAGNKLMKTYPNTAILKLNNRSK